MKKQTNSGAHNIHLDPHPSLRSVRRSTSVRVPSLERRPGHGQGRGRGRQSVAPMSCKPSGGVTRLNGVPIENQRFEIAQFICIYIYT